MWEQLKCMRESRVALLGRGQGRGEGGGAVISTNMLNLFPRKTTITFSIMMFLRTWEDLHMHMPDLSRSAASHEWDWERFCRTFIHYWWHNNDMSAFLRLTTWFQCDHLSMTTSHSGFVLAWNSAFWVWQDGLATLTLLSMPSVVYCNYFLLPFCEVRSPYIVSTCSKLQSGPKYVLCCECYAIECLLN